MSMRWVSLILAVAGMAAATSDKLTLQRHVPLPGIKGKTFTSAIVDYPPGARSAPHRHGAAFVYAYVLEGRVASRLEGHPKRVYRRGQSWIERPGAHHVVSRNASRTKPAKLLVVFVSDTGDELKVDDPPR